MTTQTSLLRLILPVQGEFSGTWGDQVNAGLTNLLDTAIAGYTTVSVTTANQAFTANNYTADQARSAIINLTTSTAANFNVFAPPAAKSYKVVNSSAYTATIYNSTVLGNTTAAGTGVAIPAGKAVTVITDGTNFVAANSHIPSLTLGTALPVASGGTGATSDATTAYALKGTNTDITALNNTNGVGFGVAPTGGINAAIQTVNGVKFPATAVLSTDPNVLDRYAEGSYTGTATGFTANPTGTITYVRVGRQVTLSFPSTFFGTSNATTFTITGGPADITPASFKNVYASLTDVGVVGIGVGSVQTDGSIVFYKAPGGVAFTASGSKSLNVCSVTYGLD